VILSEGRVSAPSWARLGNIKHRKKYSVRGVYQYLTSKYVFFTHGCFSEARVVSRQVSTNVWHGMPIKKIGTYINVDHHSVNCKFVVATSPFFARILAHAFNIPLEQVIVSGNPRNDILTRALKPGVRVKMCSTMHLVFWLPTYRQSVFGEIRLDGASESNIFNMPDLDIHELNEYLIGIDATVVVKPHPMARGLTQVDSAKKLSNIIFIDEDWLSWNELTLYEALAQSDFLITDISSVLIDYLVMDKPIICHFPDMEAYKNSRGLIWDFRPEDYGIPVVTTQAELVAALQLTLVDGMYFVAKLKKLKGLAHAEMGEYTTTLLSSLSMQ
jgi:CDP-glycerol glycerophosphotransferase (TagB/SpsB family)